MDAFKERVKKISMALDHPRRSRNVRVKHCRFKAKVMRRQSMPEAEVFNRIRGVGIPPITSAGARSYLGSKRPRPVQFPLRARVKGQ
jgi:hypothetical protein